MIWWMFKTGIKVLIIIVVIIGVVLYSHFNPSDTSVTDNVSIQQSEEALHANTSIENLNGTNQSEPQTVLGDSDGNPFIVWE